MKKACLLFWILIQLCLDTFGQDKSDNIYLETGFGTGSYSSFNIGIDMLVYETHMFTISYSIQSRISSATPPGYQAGFSFSGGDQSPIDQLQLVYFIYGKVLYIPGFTPRFALRGGIVVGNYFHPVNFVHVNPAAGSWFSIFPPYDTYTMEKDFTTGLILNPTVELPFTSVLGILGGVFSIISTQTNSYGVNINIMLGSLRDKTVQMKYRNSPY